MAVALSGFLVGAASAPDANRRGSAVPAVRTPAEAPRRDVESAQVRVSDAARLQSASFELQTAARKLQDTRQVDSVADAKRSAAAFVDAFNTARAVRTRLADGAGTGANVEAIGGNGGAADAGAAFRDAGIRIEQDGSLSVDAQALVARFNANPAAVTGALGAIGRAVDAAAPRPSAAASVPASVPAAGSGAYPAASLTPTAGGSVISSNLTARAPLPENRQPDPQMRIDDAQRATEAASRHYGFAVSGAGAYLGIFGL